MNKYRVCSMQEQTVYSHINFISMKNVQFENELVALQSNMRNFAFSLTLNRDDAEDLLS